MSLKKITFLALGFLICGVVGSVGDARATAVTTSQSLYWDFDATHLNPAFVSDVNLLFVYFSIAASDPLASGDLGKIIAFDESGTQLGETTLSPVLSGDLTPSLGITLGSLTALYTIQFSALSGSFDVGVYVNGPGAPLTILQNTSRGQNNVLGTERAAAVPIPAALPLFAGGLGLLAWMARRKRYSS